MVADVKGSSVRPDVHSILDERLPRLAKVHVAEKLISLPYAVTAGDEFQTITSTLDEIPRLIFDLRRKLRPLILRIGIGFGDVSERVRPPVNEMGGEAFQLARRALESLKGNRLHKFEVLTAFRSRNEAFDCTVNLVYGLHDTLVQNISEKQWDTIDMYLRKRSVALTAEALDLNVSTASRNLRRGYFWQLEETMESMKKIIRTTFGASHASVQREEIARNHAAVR